MDLKSLFLDYFERDLQTNLLWANHLEDNSDLVDIEDIRLFSHVLNAHYIWNCRLFKVEEESNMWDELSPVHFERLAKDNFQKTTEYIEFSDSFSELHSYVEYDDKHEKLTSDILMHILFHAAHHRGQLTKSFKSKGYVLPNEKLIVK